MSTITFGHIKILLFSFQCAVVDRPAQEKSGDLGMTSMEKNCIFKDTVSIMGGRVGKNPNLKVGTQFSREGGGLKNKKVFLILKVRIY